MDDLRERLQFALADSHEIERELGGGGMSRTYLARERAFDRRVVVKVLAPELLAGLSVERFRREVLLAAKPESRLDSGYERTNRTSASRLPASALFSALK